MGLRQGCTGGRTALTPSTAGNGLGLQCPWGWARSSTQPGAPTRCSSGDDRLPPGTALAHGLAPGADFRAGLNPAEPGALSSLRREPVHTVTVVRSPSRAQLRDPTACSTPGFPVLHHLPELAQTLVHCVRDAIHPTLPGFLSAAEKWGTLLGAWQRGLGLSA